MTPSSKEGVIFMTQEINTDERGVVRGARPHGNAQ